MALWIDSYQSIAIVVVNRLIDVISAGAAFSSTIDSTAIGQYSRVFEGGLRVGAMFSAALLRILSFERRDQLG